MALKRERPRLAMFQLSASTAARLVLAYGLLGSASILAVSAVFYVGTIGVLDRNLENAIGSQSERMLAQHRAGSYAQLTQAVNQQLNDGIDSEHEIFMLRDATGHRSAGNLRAWPWRVDEAVLYSGPVQRDGHAVPARLLLTPLAGGGLLVVGRDLGEQEAIRGLVWRALGAGAAVALLLTLLGAWLFRQQIEQRLGAIRRTAEQIGAGDLRQRIPVSGNDEFALLNRDINRMLDRIEQLMDGIRHVSNAIAHDLRTPLGRIRSKLDDALRHDMTVDILAGAAHDAIDDIDDLIRLFERLLQIAEAESGVRGQLFERLDLQRIAVDITEMYEASAEELGMRLSCAAAAPLYVEGDRNLLASAVASLIDNALKYAGPGATIAVRCEQRQRLASIAVHDNGPGIPAAERDKVTQRFYRLDRSRHRPGNGLGLSIVSATATAHGGTLRLDDGQPGLVAAIILPAAGWPGLETGAAPAAAP